jgi:hypothetical protein
VPLALPQVAMFSTDFSYLIMPSGFSFEFARLSEMHKYSILFLGAIWLLMSGWTVTRLYHTPKHVEEIV